MVIDKIGNINNIIEPKKNRPASGSKEVKKNDSVQISSEGKMASEISRHTQIVHETSDIRADRVKAIKEQIEKGTYDFDDNKVLEKVAGRIASFLLRE